MVHYFVIKTEICAFVLALIGLAVAVSDVEYKGRKYVLEGDSFTISCVRTYGLRKWSKDGSAIVSDDDYTLSEKEIGNNVFVMTLHVDFAEWKHRGEYKCDPFGIISHRIEVVPLTDFEDQASQTAVSMTINETLELHCSDVDNSVFPINWYKDGSRIIDGGKYTISEDGRALYIHQVSEADAGEYLCAVEVSGLSYPVAGSLSHVIQVTFAARVDPFPLQIRPILGRNLTLECRIYGYPAPRVTWFIDDVPSEDFIVNNSRYMILDNQEGFPNSVFFIEDVTYDDVHLVTCVAENFQGSMDTTVLLAVRDNMINTNEEYPGKGIELSPGSDLVLQCNTTDDPTLEVVWSKDGHALNLSDTRLHIEKYNNTLVIQKATEADTGKYTCTAETVNATIAVRTKVKLMPMDSSRNIVQGNSVTLHCNVTQGIPPPVLEWFKDDVPLNLSDPRIIIKPDEKGIADSELTITNVDFADRAEYMCRATNDLGSANVTILVRVKDKYAALWPFLGICAEVAVLCTIIFIYEKKRQKPDFDESENDANTENKNIPDQEEKSHDIRQRK